MIKQIPMYTVICDNCGADAFSDADYRAWNSEDAAEEMAEYEEWVTIDGKHYCCSCVQYNDDDELIIPPKLANDLHEERFNLCK